MEINVVIAKNANVLEETVKVQNSLKRKKETLLNS